MVDRSLEDVLSVVRSASGRTASLIAYSAAQKDRVEELLDAQDALTPAVQTGLNEIFDIETADAAAIDAAVAAPNPSPVDPAPVPEPVPPVVT